MGQTNKFKSLKKDMSFMEYPLYFLSEKDFVETNLKKGKEPYKAKVWRLGW